MLRLALYTGARGCEILQLMPSSLGDRSVTVVAAKGSNNRTIPLQKSFFLEIKQYILKNNIQENELLFPITTRQYRRIWDEYRPNKNKGAHSLRHTAGTLLYVNCGDIRKVQALLGQKQINNTMVYLDYVEGVRNLRSSMKNMWSKKINEE